MLECATDEQRDRLVEAVSSDIGGIAVNMHGTRAIQKMIGPSTPVRLRADIAQTT